MSTSRKPAEVFRPGSYVAEEIAARGWSAKKFLKISGFTAQEAVGLLDGTQPITPVIALALALTFGTSPELWLRLEEAWQAWQGV